MPTISWQQKFSTKNEKSVRKTNESTNMVAAQRSVNPYKSIFITNIHQKCQTFIHYFIFFSALFHIFRCLIASFYFLSFAYKFFTTTPLFPYTVYTCMCYGFSSLSLEFSSPYSCSIKHIVYTSITAILFTHSFVLFLFLLSALSSRYTASAIIEPR